MGIFSELPIHSHFALQLAVVSADFQPRFTSLSSPKRIDQSSCVYDESHAFPLWNSFIDCRLFRDWMTAFFHWNKYPACLPNQERHEGALRMISRMTAGRVAAKRQHRVERVGLGHWLSRGMSACFHSKALACLFNNYFHSGAIGARSISTHISVSQYTTERSREKTLPASPQKSRQAGVWLPYTGPFAMNNHPGSKAKISLIDFHQMKKSSVIV